MFRVTFVPATVVALSLALTGASGWARDNKESAEPKPGSVNEQMDSLVKQGPGVYDIKKDRKGRVQSLIVVGQSRISTVLGAAKGKELARRRAEHSAKAAFVKWLGEGVLVCENAENETTLFLQGEEGPDKNAVNEAGKAVEKNTDTYKSVSAGLVRGLQLLYPDVDPKDMTFTLVYGWSLANAKGAKHVATSDPGIEAEPSVPGTGGEKRLAKGAADKEIRRQKGPAVKEAGEYLNEPSR